jgi:predicted nucleic acid-binding protein
VSVFVDSSVWFAAANIRDQHNDRAKQVLGGLRAPLTSDHVVVETWLLLNSRVSRAAAEAFWRGIRKGIATVEYPTPADAEAAWAIAQRFADQTFSIVDRTSFAVMERLGVTRVASFDRDFAIYRYGRNRDKAFDVLR